MCCYSVGRGVGFSFLRVRRLTAGQHFHKPGDFPVTEYVSARTLALPFFTKMTSAQVNRVCDVLEKTLEKTLVERKGRF